MMPLRRAQGSILARLMPQEGDCSGHALSPALSPYSRQMPKFQSAAATVGALEFVAHADVDTYVKEIPIFWAACSLSMHCATRLSITARVKFSQKWVNINAHSSSPVSYGIPIVPISGHSFKENRQEVHLL